MKTILRKYNETHPWLDFDFELVDMGAEIWSVLEKAWSRCDQLSTVPIAPTLAAPENAPLPGFDLANLNLNFVDLFPENFFSMDGLQVIVDEGGGPLVLTVSCCTIEYVYNPEIGEASGSWKTCLSFAEMPTRLVLNKTRAKSVMEIARSPYTRDWGGIGRSAIYPGIKNGRAQIVIEPVPDSTGQPEKSEKEAVHEPAF